VCLVCEPSAKKWVPRRLELKKGIWPSTPTHLREIHRWALRTATIRNLLEWWTKIKIDVEQATAKPTVHSPSRCAPRDPPRAYDNAPQRPGRAPVLRRNWIFSHLWSLRQNIHRGSSNHTHCAAPSLKMTSCIKPNAWVALKLPSGTTKVLQVTPNTWVFFHFLPSHVLIAVHNETHLLTLRSQHNLPR
jgi:hypothetical protein